MRLLAPRSAGHEHINRDRDACHVRAEPDMQAIQLREHTGHPDVRQEAVQVKRDQEEVYAAIRDGAWNVTAISSRTGIKVTKLYPVLAQLERSNKITSCYDNNSQRRRYEARK